MTVLVVYLQQPRWIVPLSWRELKAKWGEGEGLVNQFQLRAGRGLFRDKREASKQNMSVGGVYWGLFIDSNFQLG